MDFAQALWHVAGFFVQSVVAGAIAAGLAKLVWRRRLAFVPWWRLALQAAAAMAAAAVAGGVAFAQDGRMATYAAMVVSAALALWWFGLRKDR